LIDLLIYWDYSVDESDANAATVVVIGFTSPKKGGDKAFGRRPS
jgi:hypothetical protein